MKIRSSVHTSAQGTRVGQEGGPKGSSVRLRLGVLGGGGHKVVGDHRDEDDDAKQIDERHEIAIHVLPHLGASQGTRCTTIFKFTS